MSAKHIPKADRKVHAESDTPHIVTLLSAVWFTQDDNVRNPTLLAWVFMAAAALRLWCSER